MIFITFKTRDKTYSKIEKAWFLLLQWVAKVLLYHLHQEIMQKKSEIKKKKHNFLGQALDFLPPRKPSLYVSRVDFFFFEYHEYLLSISGGWNNICPVGN